LLLQRLQGACACAPTAAEATALRAASEQLLVFAAAQVLGATTALLVPARQKVAVFNSPSGWDGKRAIAPAASC
jgi:hypothetical protein